MREGAAVKSKGNRQAEIQRSEIPHKLTWSKGEELERGVTASILRCQDDTPFLKQGGTDW